MRLIASVFTLLSPQLLKSTMLLWVVFIGNAFSYYGLVLLTTEPSNKDNTCTPNHTLSESRKSVDVNYKDVFITSVAEFSGLLLSAAMVDKVGRKVSMASMFFLCCLFLLPLAFSQSGNFVTPLLFGARICITVTFTIVYIYTLEMHPMNRSTPIAVDLVVVAAISLLCMLLLHAVVGTHPEANHHPVVVVASMLVLHSDLT